jgi:hypothetical protein
MENPVTRTHRAVLCLWFFQMMAASALLAQSPVSPLKGVTKVTAGVRLAGNSLPVATLTEERLQTLLELRLRTAGLRVLTSLEDRVDPEINPMVQLFVLMIPARTQGGVEMGHAFTTRLEVNETRLSPRNAALVDMELWSSNYINITDRPTAAAEVERVVATVLDELVNEWLRANPR